MSEITKHVAWNK